MGIFNRITEIVRTIRFAASPRLYGRHSSGAGDGEEISIGSGIVLEGGVLSIAGNHSHTIVNIVNGSFVAKIRNDLESTDTFDLPKNPSGAVLCATGREDGKPDYVKDGLVTGCTLSNCNISADCTFNLSQSATVPFFADMVIQKTSNTQLTFKLKGSDGVTRSGSITLS